jgi:DNA-binding HxlR family transcriptional regulator
MKNQTKENTMTTGEIQLERNIAVASVAGPGCMLKKVLDIIGGKWKILILCALHQGVTVRYGELKKMIYGITNAMLANSLKDLEDDSLVHRELFDERPLRVEYSLTEKGNSIVPILLTLKDWGTENLD